MVIASISRSEHPVRQLVLLRTLLSDFGLRLCAQKDVVSLLLNALGGQLERIHGTKEVGEAIRPQLVGVLATCKQFSNDTIRFCLSEVDASQRKLLCTALAESPDPQLMALGATAAEQDSSMQFAAGSAIRAASRSRGMSPLSEPSSSTAPRPAVLSRHTSRSNLSGKPPEAPIRRADSQKAEKEEKAPGFGNIRVVGMCQFPLARLSIHS